MIAAVVVLLLAFASVVAMGLPIAMALAGLAIAISATWLWATILPVNDIAPILVSMIGLAVGIDYSLFVVTRHRQELARGHGAAHAAGLATATSGLAVVFAGGTVVIAILGLVVAGIPFVTALGVTTATAVATAVVLAVTLLPSLLGLFGSKIDALAVPGLDSGVDSSGDGDEDNHPNWSQRWARQVTEHAWWWLVGGIAVLLMLAAPTLSIRLGFPDAGTAPPGSTRRAAYDLMTATRCSCGSPPKARRRARRPRISSGVCATTPPRAPETQLGPGFS